MDRLLPTSCHVVTSDGGVIATNQSIDGVAIKIRTAITTAMVVLVVLVVLAATMAASDVHSPLAGTLNISIADMVNTVCPRNTKR